MTDHSTVTGRLRGLRELARVTIQDAAAMIGVSYASFWNAERGYRKFKDHQLELLEAFYAQKINERLNAVSQSLGTEGN